MTAPRFCSMATATGPPAKRWRSVAAQSSTASGVFSSLLISMRLPVVGVDATTGSFEAQSIAAKAAKAGSAEGTGSVDMKSLHSEAGWPDSGESLIVVVIDGF